MADDAGQPEPAAPDPAAAGEPAVTLDDCTAEEIQQASDVWAAGGASVIIHHAAPEPAAAGEPEPETALTKEAARAQHRKDMAASSKKLRSIMKTPSGERTEEQKKEMEALQDKHPGIANKYKAQKQKEEVEVLNKKLKQAYAGLVEVGIESVPEFILDCVQNMGWPSFEWTDPRDGCEFTWCHAAGESAPGVINWVLVGIPEMGNPEANRVSAEGCYISREKDGRIAELEAELATAKQVGHKLLIRYDDALSQFITDVGYDWCEACGQHTEEQDHTHGDRELYNCDDCGAILSDSYAAETRPFEMFRHT